MAIRHRALARLQRHVPAATGIDDRPLARRVGDRQTDPPAGPSLVGDVVVSRDEVHERSLRGPDVGPNVPQLIRLVRTPYALSPVRPGRRSNTERPVVRELATTRERETESMVSRLEAGRVRVDASSPMDRAAAAFPAPPFARRRRDHEGADVDSVPVGVE